VDRAEELILSVIINVDQGMAFSFFIFHFSFRFHLVFFFAFVDFRLSRAGKMEEEWPLQVFDHEGRPSIVFMEPGTELDIVQDWFI
jgi:hypothetical protein